MTQQVAKQQLTEEGASWIGSVAKWHNDTYRPAIFCAQPLCKKMSNPTPPDTSPIQRFLLGWGLGARWLDGLSALKQPENRCPPSIQKRCTCGLPHIATSPPFQLCFTGFSATSISAFGFPGRDFPYRLGFFRVPPFGF